MKPTVLLKSAILKFAAVPLHVPGTGVFRAMSKIPRSVAAGGLAMGAAGAAASTQLPGYNAAHGGDKITAENLKRLGDNNAKTQTDLVQGHSRVPGGDPRDSDFVGPGLRSDMTRENTSWDQTGKEVSDFQTKGFSPEFASALGTTKGLGRARQAIDSAEHGFRASNKKNLEREIVAGVSPNQAELRARAGMSPVKKFEPGPEIGADQAAIAADLEKQIAADDGSVSPKSPELPVTADQKPIEVPGEEVAKAGPEIVKAEPSVGEAGAFRAPTSPTVASRVGDAMDPRNEDLSPAPAVTTTTDTTKPPVEPGLMDRLGSGATAAVDWAKANPALAAGGVGAVGLLAYLLSKNDEAPQRKRRRLAAA